MTFFLALVVSAVVEIFGLGVQVPLAAVGDKFCQSLLWRKPEPSSGLILGIQTERKKW